MISADQVRSAVRPLRLIFWGGLLCIFDLSISSTTRVAGSVTGFKFDLLDDTVGAILITMGVVRLGAIAGVRDPRYRQVMRLIRWVCYAAIVETIDAHFIYDRPEPFVFLLHAFGLVRLAATIAFCIAMRWFCESAPGLDLATRSWRTTTSLLVFLYALPLAFFYSASLVAIATRSPFHLDLGPAGLCFLFVLVAPLIHMFVSTSRMAREAENVVDYPGGDEPLDDPGTGSWSGTQKLGALAALALAALAIFGLAIRDTRLVTGDFCEIKIVSVDLGRAPDYHVSISYTERYSSGTEVSEWILEDGKPRRCGFGSYDGGPFGSPSGGSGTLGVGLNPDREPLTEREVRARLLVTGGQTVNLRPGERLVLFKFTDSRGEHEEWFEVSHRH